MKKIFYILLFASFIFLFIYLINLDYIVPEVLNYLNLSISIILLFAGFVASTISWYVALRSHGVHIPVRLALISHGQSVFAKYIPGKVWVILGRASYISSDKKEMKTNSIISFKEQIIYLWVGFLISSIPTIIFYKFEWISILLLSIIIGITIFLFSQNVNKWGQRVIQRIFKRTLEIPILRFRDSLAMIISVSIIWIFWTSGFYLFMTAFSQNITPIMMFAFPLSVCFGLLAIISPGGLGVREGIIIGYLTLASLDLESSSSISFFNRLWFISGELFLFLLALFMKFTSKKRS